METVYPQSSTRLLTQPPRRVRIAIVRGQKRCQAELTWDASCIRRLRPGRRWWRRKATAGFDLVKEKLHRVSHAVFVYVQPFHLLRNCISCLCLCLARYHCFHHANSIWAEVKLICIMRGYQIDWGTWGRRAMERVFSSDAEAIARRRMGEGERNNKMQLYNLQQKRHSGRNKYRDRRFTLFHFTKPQRLI